MYVPFNSAMVSATRSVNYYSATGYSSESYSATQPEGFSALCGTSKMYLNYRVISSKIRVSFNPTSTADNLFAVVGATAIGTQSTTTIWTASQAPNSSKIETFTSIEQKQCITREFTTAHLFGVPESAIRVNDDYAATSGSSPASEWAWVVQWQIIDNSTSNAVMGLRLEVEYDVEFFKATTGGLPDTYTKVSRCVQQDTANLNKLPSIGWADECDTPLDPPEPHLPSQSAAVKEDLIWVNGSQYLRVGAPLHDHAKIKA
jgi:hypothetical protein